MGITLTEAYFTTEQEALVEIADRGWHAVTFDVPAQEEEMHWHDFDAVVYVLSGTVRAELADGTTAFVGQEVRDHGVVRGRLRMFGMEANFEREYRRAFDFVRADHLGFVVLADRLLGTEPHLDPVAMRAVAARTELRGSHAEQNVADIVEQRLLHGASLLAAS